MGKQIKNQAITSRDEDFAQWYTDVCKKAKLMGYSNVKGFIEYMPYGYAMWEQIQSYLDKRFKEEEAQNVYLPLVIPMSLFNIEKEHVEGFAPEALIATYGGGKELEDPLVIRPTSEILFSELFKKTISSHRDLPVRYNQWCSVVRWEKTTRPFLRGSEFLWQEGHCLFETEAEAEENVKRLLNVYDECGKEVLAIPFLKGKKTDHEKFAGAIASYTIEALMQDGKALQSGTSHYLGQGFAKAYGISYLGKENKLETPYQTSWGVSTRLLGAIIMVHGDDNGLVLPPMVAPIQTVIVPIRMQDPSVQEECQKLYDELKALGIRVKLDMDDSRTPGWKFSQYEMMGIPLRIELGPRDIKNGKAILAKRYNGTKETVELNDLANSIPEILKSIQEEMYNKAKENLEANIHDASTVEECKELLKEGGYVRMSFCGSEECELAIKEATEGGTTRCIIQEIDDDSVKCPVCGKPAKLLTYFAKAY